jgi:DNA polymerase III sliding clamp (beta) subunit (PCNA family)
MSKNVEIKLTNDYPMKLTYILDDNESKITFYMAPKINEDT